VGSSLRQFLEGVLDFLCPLPRLAWTSDGKVIPLKANVDEAYGHAPGAARVIVVTRTGGGPTNAEDSLIILYTSGSSGKRKGVLHATGGYFVYAAMTHQCSSRIRKQIIGSPSHSRLSIECCIGFWAEA